MAVMVLEGGLATGPRMASTTSLLQGAAMPTSPGAASPLLRMNGSLASSADRAILPSCRGLKVNCTGRTRTASVIRSASAHQGPKGIVCEAQETVVGCGVVSESTFKTLVLDSDIPVLVDFWAPWCGPCRMIAPLIDELARQYAGKIRCLKLNTDESPGIATEYGIRSIPTVMIFKGGEKRDTVIGAVPKSTLMATLDKYLD